MLVRLVVRLGVLEEWLVLMVHIKMIVFLQMYMNSLEMRYVLVFGVDLFG